MTLGGLALAVGILVDDATVTIENINRHLEEGEDVEPAILEGSRRDHGAGARLDALHLHRVRADVPADRRGALSVRADGRSGGVRDAHLVLLSRTLVPTLAKYWLRTGGQEQRREPPNAPSLLQRFQRGFEARFEAFRDALSALCSTALLAAPRRCSSAVFLGVRVASMLLYPVARPQLLPGGRRRADQAARARAHRHARGGDGGAGRPRRGGDARGDPAERAREHRRQRRPAGLEHQPHLQQLRHRSARSDADILVSLKPDHAPTADYVRALRQRAAAASSRASTFAFLPADIVSQILNFGLPAPIDVQIVGPEPEEPRRRQPAAGVAAPRPGARRPARAAGLQPARAARRRPTAAARSSSASASRTSRTTCCSRCRAAGRSRRRSGSTRETGVQYPLVAQAPQYRMTSLAGPAEPAGHARARPAADPRRPRHHHARLRAARSSRTTMRSRSSTSSAPCRTATSARVARTSMHTIATLRAASCPRARTSWCAARCRR